MMKIISLAILLSFMTIEINAQDFSTNNSTIKDDQNVLELRKVSVPTILQGIAYTCLQIAKLAGAKTKQEKQAEACLLASTVIQIAADAAKENKENKQKKKTKHKNENKTKEKSSETETRTTHLTYLDKIQTLSSEDEILAYLYEILNNKTETKKLLDEMTNFLNTSLLDELFKK